MKPNKQHAPTSPDGLLKTAAALAAFDAATDVFTTCRKCGQVVGAARVDGQWRIAEHGCTSGK